MLTKKVTLKSVKDSSEASSLMLNIVYTLEITDDSETGNGFTKDYPVLYKDDKSLTIDERIQRLIDKIIPLMQADIDVYEREQFLINHPKAVASATTIENALELHDV